MRTFLACALCVALAGCGSSSESDSGDDQDVKNASVDPSNLITDDELEGGDDIDAEGIQTVLEKHHSYLAGYEDDSGKRASEIIADAAHGANIRATYLLARIQGESSLIESGASRNLTRATGCGCSDGAKCNTAVGFGPQVKCAANLMRAYLQEMEDKGATRTGWRVGHAKNTLDPCAVTPANRATAAMYTYTPWVGSRGKGCGRHDVGGVSLVATIVHKYQRELQPPQQQQQQ
jgi:hypothetical protein